MQEKLSETGEEARKKMEEVKIKEAKHEDEAYRRAREAHEKLYTRDDETERYVI